MAIILYFNFVISMAMRGHVHQKYSNYFTAIMKPPACKISILQRNQAQSLSFSMPGHVHQHYYDYLKAFREQHLHAKYQYNNSTKSKNIDNLSIWHNLGMPRHA